MEEADPWLGLDKLEHVVACLFITIAVAALAGRSGRPMIRRRSAAIGSISALAAGAAKEAGDELGFWASSGASTRDAAADLLGVVIASLSLAILRRLRPLPSANPSSDRALSLV